MDKPFFKRTAGFTLVELLIVVGILAVLLSLLTPAILKNIAVVSERQHDNERKLLEAALMEYWHDQGEWPIPKKGKDGYKKPDANSRLSFRYDNYVVFNTLLRKSLLNERSGKDYIDPAVHTTTREKCDEKDYPNFLVARLVDAIEGDHDVSARKELTLVYWKKLIECPECPTDDLRRFQGIGASKCSNPNCKFLKSKGYAYAFSPSQKRRFVKGLLPYRVTIDLLNNRAIVTDD